MASLTAQDRTVPEIKHALDVRCAVALGDYVKLFELAAVAPNMGGYLMDHFVAREQTLALQAMSKAYVLIHCIDRPRPVLTNACQSPQHSYRPNLAVSYIQKVFKLDSDEATKQLLSEMGCIVLDDLLDTKASLPHLAAKTSTFSKVDIKGQL